MTQRNAVIKVVLWFIYIFSLHRLGLQSETPLLLVVSNGAFHQFFIKRMHSDRFLLQNDSSSSLA